MINVNVGKISSSVSHCDGLLQFILLEAWEYVRSEGTRSLIVFAQSSK